MTSRSPTGCLSVYTPHRATLQDKNLVVWSSASPFLPNSQTRTHTPRERLRAQPQHEPAGAGSGVVSARTNRRDAALRGSGLRRSPAGTCCCGRCSGRTAPAPGKSAAGRASGGSAVAAPPRPPPPRRPRPPPPRRRWGSCRRRTVRGAHGQTSRTCA